LGFGLLIIALIPEHDTLIIRVFIINFMQGTTIMNKMTQISHVTLLVRNQDEACAFYTEKLGFVVTESHKAEDGTYYWLTVAPTKDAATVLTLMLPQTEEDKALIGKQSGSIPLLVLRTDDCFKTGAELTAKEVTFVKQPISEFWGIDSVIKDLYGNLIDICQPNEDMK
jgi:catechol 2,3-dioxygenase-like lactoylglutathione lyase family enzyme